MRLVLVITALFLLPELSNACAFHGRGNTWGAWVEHSSSGKIDHRAKKPADLIQVEAYDPELALAQAREIDRLDAKSRRLRALKKPIEILNP